MKIATTEQCIKPSYLCPTEEIADYLEGKVLDGFKNFYETLKTEEPGLAEKFRATRSGIRYGGKDILNDSFELAAALWVRDPDLMTEYSEGDVDWLSRYVRGFDDALRSEQKGEKERREKTYALQKAGVIETEQAQENERLAKKIHLIRQNIICPDGSLTPKGYAMIDGLREQSGEEAAVKAYDTIERIASKKCEGTRLTEKGREFVSDMVSEPEEYDFMANELAESDNPLTLIAAPVFSYLAQKKAKRALEAEEKLGGIVKPEPVEGKWHGTLMKLGAAAAVGLMVFGAAAGVVAGHDVGHGVGHDGIHLDAKDIANGTHSRDAGYNAGVYNYNASIDATHPIKTLVNTNAEERFPVAYKNEVAFARYNSTISQWQVWNKNISTGKEKLVFTPALHSEPEGLAFYNSSYAIYDGFDLSVLSAINGTPVRKDFDMSPKGIDMWGDKLIYSEFNWNTDNTNAFLLNLSNWQKTRLNYADHSPLVSLHGDIAIFERDANATQGSGFYLTNLTNNATEKISLPAYPTGIDLYGRNLVINTQFDGTFLKNLDTGKSVKFYASGAGVNNPRIYDKRLVWDRSETIYTANLNKWMPQLNLPGEIKMNEGKPFLMYVNASDPDSPILNFTDDTFLIDINRTTGKIIDSSPQTWYNAGDAFNITVTDESGNSVKKLTKLNVIPNQPPWFGTKELPRVTPFEFSVRIPAGDSQGKLTYNFSGKVCDIPAYDPDNDTIYYAFSKNQTQGATVTSLGNGTDKMSIGGNVFYLDNGTGELYAYGELPIGRYDKPLSVSVTDSRSVVEKSLYINLIRNSAPVLKLPIVTNGVAGTVTIGNRTLLSYSVKDANPVVSLSANDNDNDPMKFYFEAKLGDWSYSMLSNGTRDSKAGTTLISSPLGNMACKASVTDGYDTELVDFIINHTGVNPVQPPVNNTTVNHAPVFKDVSPVSMHLRSSHWNGLKDDVTLLNIANVSATDKDGDKITYGVKASSDFPFPYHNDNFLQSPDGMGYSDIGTHREVLVDKNTGQIFANGGFDNNKTYKAMITASDGKNITEKEVPFKFVLNHAPVVEYVKINGNRINATDNNKTITLPYSILKSVNLEFSAHDADSNGTYNDITNYKVLIDGSEQYFYNGPPDKVRDFPYFNFPQKSSVPKSGYQYSVVVTDNFGEQTTLNVVLKMEPKPSTPPAWQPTADFLDQNGEALCFGAAASVVVPAGIYASALVSRRWNEAKRKRWREVLGEFDKLKRKKKF